MLLWVKRSSITTNTMCLNCFLKYFMSVLDYNIYGQMVFIFWKRTSVLVFWRFRRKSVCHFVQHDMEFWSKPNTFICYFHVISLLITSTLALIILSWLNYGFISLDCWLPVNFLWGKQSSAWGVTLGRLETLRICQ